MALLIERFTSVMASTQNKFNQHRDHVHSPLVESGLRVLLQALASCEKVYFIDSTMAMLVDHFHRFDEIANQVMAMVGEDGVEAIYERALSFRGVWVQFAKPFVCDDLSVLSFFCYQPSQYVETGKDGFQLYLINEYAQVVDVLSTQMKGDGWQYEETYHRLQCDLCTPTRVCDRCGMILVTWSTLFTLSSIIGGQYLAQRRYEEKVFTTMHHVKREKSNKERRVPVKYVFKTIDANEMIIMVPKHDEEKPERGHRGSWLEGADVVYEEIRTRPFARMYRHARYVNMKGLTTEFPHGIIRNQPMLAENVGKHVTKVKASKYEEEETHG